MHYTIRLCAPVKQLNNTLLWDSLTDTPSRSRGWPGLKITCFVFPVLFLTWIDFPAHTAAQAQFRAWCGDQGWMRPEAAATSTAPAPKRPRITKHRRASPHLPLIIIPNLRAEAGPGNTCPVWGTGCTGADIGFTGAAAGPAWGCVRDSDGQEWGYWDLLIGWGPTAWSWFVGGFFFQNIQAKGMTTSV